MFGTIRSEFQCLEGLGQNSNVWKGKVRILMFGRVGQKKPILGRIRNELQC